jgi:hypothetical protein
MRMRLHGIMPARMIPSLVAAYETPAQLAELTAWTPGKRA